MGENLGTEAGFPAPVLAYGNRVRCLLDNLESSFPDQRSGCGPRSGDQVELQRGPGTFQRSRAFSLLHPAIAMRSTALSLKRAADRALAGEQLHFHCDTRPEVFLRERDAHAFE